MGTRKPPPQKTGPATKFANAEINRELCWLAVHDYVEHKRDEGMDLSTLQSMDYNEVMSEIFDGGTTFTELFNASFSLPSSSFSSCADASAHALRTPLLTPPAL
jgi:hypothetical protein